MSNRPVYGIFTKVQQGKQYTMYSEIDKCDKCGATTQSANSTPWVVTPLNEWADIFQLNQMFHVPMNASFRFLSSPLPEMYYDEETDGTCCDECA